MNQQRLASNSRMAIATAQYLISPISCLAQAASAASEHPMVGLQLIRQSLSPIQFFSSSIAAMPTPYEC